MSGYDIKKIVDVDCRTSGTRITVRSTRHSTRWSTMAWPRSPSTRAVNANAICTASLLVARRHFTNGLEQPADPPRVRNEFQLKFFLSSKLPLKTSLRIVQEHRVQQQEVLQEYRASEVVLRKALDTGEYPEPGRRKYSPATGCDLTQSKKAKQCNIFLLTLRQGIRVTEARVAWCDEVID